MSFDYGGVTACTKLNSQADVAVAVTTLARNATHGRVRTAVAVAPVSAIIVNHCGVDVPLTSSGVGERIANSMIAVPLTPDVPVTADIPTLNEATQESGHQTSLPVPLIVIRAGLAMTADQLLLALLPGVFSAPVVP